MTFSAAQAGGFGIRPQSAAGQGTSFAGVAAGGGLSSMFWNPASLSDVENIAAEADAIVIVPAFKVKVDPLPAAAFSGSDEGDIARDVVIPALYLAYRADERVVFGLGINSPFGLVSKYDGTSILATSGIAGTTKVVTFDVNPAVSVAVTDWLVLAVGLQAEYFSARLNGQSLGALGLSTLQGDDIGFDFTAGLKVMPLPGTEIGLGYRSSIAHELDGDLKTANAGDFDVRFDGVNTPDIVTFGIRQQLTDRLRVMAGAEWWNWSRFDTVDVKDGPAPIALSFDYDDGWFFSAGGEFDVTPELTLRSGIGYELSPIDEHNRSFRLPDNDQLWLSAGLSYEIAEHFSFDVGYSLIIPKKTEIRAADEGGPASNGSFSGDSDNLIHCLSVAFRARFD